MTMNSSSSPPEVDTASLATFVDAEVIENGDAVRVLLRERDGTVSSIRLDIRQLAD